MVGNQIFYCRYCGKQIEKEAKLCQNCGSKSVRFYLDWKIILLSFNLLINISVLIMMIYVTGVMSDFANIISMLDGFITRLEGLSRFFRG